MAIEGKKYKELQEIRERGTPDFPIGYYFNQYAGPGSVLHCHWHTQAQWIHVVRGSANFTIGERSINMVKGESLFVPPGFLHSGFSANAAGCDYLTVVFDMEDVYSSPPIISILFRDFNSGRFTPNIYYRNDSEGNKKINQQLLTLHLCMNTQTRGYEAIAVSVFQQILGLTLQYSLYTSESSPKQGRDHRISVDGIEFSINYMHNHYEEKITLQMLADVSSLSVQSFCKHFKAAIGITVINYLNNYRVYQASKILRTTSLPIGDIAKKCGFDTPSYFIKTFKRAKGVTPLEFRNQI